MSRTGSPRSVLARLRSCREVDMEEVPAGRPELPDAVDGLLSALDGADDLPLDERLELLRRAEVSIAGVLEGLDGL